MRGFVSALLLTVICVFIGVSSVFSEQASSEETRIIDAISEAKTRLESVVLLKSAQIAGYFEELTMNGAKTKVKRTDFARKEIALALYNKVTGAVEIIKIAKEKMELVNLDNRFVVKISPRITGLHWNSFNTAYTVAEPLGWVVIANKYPVYNHNKANRRDVIYSPYSPDLHSDELVLAGREYLKIIIEKSKQELEKSEVKSKAFSDKFISDTAFTDFVRDLIVIEHWDPDEFLLASDKEKTSERALVILGANREDAFNKTSSPKAAHGLAQFIPSTYHSMRRLYPNAGLSADFTSGSSEHINAVKAALLLCDYNTSILIEAFGKEIVNDDQFFLYLAAMYNGGERRVLRSIKKFGVNWKTGLRPETKIYIQKLEFLNIN